MLGYSRQTRTEATGLVIEHTKELKIPKNKLLKRKKKSMHFTKEQWIDGKHMNRWLTSLVIRKKKFKERDSVWFLRLDKLMVTSVGDTTELGAHGLEPLGQIGQGLVVINKVLLAYPPTCLYVARGSVWATEQNRRDDIWGAMTLPRRLFPRQSISVLNLLPCWDQTQDLVHAGQALCSWATEEEGQYPSNLGKIKRGQSHECSTSRFTWDKLTATQRGQGQFLFTYKNEYRHLFVFRYTFICFRLLLTLVFLLPSEGSTTLYPEPARLMLEEFAPCLRCMHGLARAASRL